MQQDYVLISVPLLPQSTLRKRQVQLLYFRVDPAFASLLPSGGYVVLKERSSLVLPRWNKGFSLPLKRPPLPYLLREVSLLSLPLQQDMTLLVAIVAIGPYLGASVESFSTGLSHPKKESKRTYPLVHNQAQGRVMLWFTFKGPFPDRASYRSTGNNGADWWVVALRAPLHSFEQLRPDPHWALPNSPS